MYLSIRRKILVTVAMDDNLWLIELESALQDECTVNDIYSICRGKALPESVRPDVWQVCLDVRHKTDQLVQFNEIFDLPFQAQLRQDCQSFVESLGNDDEDKVSVICDLESILTFYCKNRHLKYEQGNGWIELLLPLLSLKLRKSETYNLFEGIRDMYIPKGCFKKSNVFNVFRLLILYHDPELCTVLDTKRITPEMYAKSWFQSLFAATCSLPVVLSMWDLYFQQSDPFSVFFLSLIMLVNGREQILAMKTEDKNTIVGFLINMPCALESDDVIDFCSLAQYYAMKTPASFKTDLLKTLFGLQPDSGIAVHCCVSQVLCLPVGVYELVENSSMENPHADVVRFFLVDCRPAEQYNAGHLCTAFHLDSNLMLQEPVAFSTCCVGLLRAQRLAIEANSNAGGEHLCFMGSGHEDEDQYTHMVIASFLQKGTQYVSMLTGGYAAIHDYFGEHMIDCLEDHDAQKCLVCSTSNNNLTRGNASNAGNNVNNKASQRTKTSPNITTERNTKVHRQSSIDIFSKISAAMKIKSAEVKGKLLDYIVSPNGQNGDDNVDQGSPRPSRDKTDHTKFTRNSQRAVFSIDEEHGDSLTLETASDNGNQTKEVSLKTYLKQPEVLNSFKCQEVLMNGFMHESHLIVTETHLIVLRSVEGSKDKALLMVRRPLQNIVKITAKKKYRDVITFKYGIPDGDGLNITDMDRFLIPNASEATAIVSKYIFNQLENNAKENS